MMTPETRAAWLQLMTHNPIHRLVRQDQFRHMVDEFYKTHGGEAIQALVGAHLWAKQNIKPNLTLVENCEQTAFIEECFCHDLGGRNDEGMCPRSSGYLDVFKEYYENGKINYDESE